MALTDTLHLGASKKPLDSPYKTLNNLSTTAGSKVITSTLPLNTLPNITPGDILYIETGDIEGYYIIDSSSTYTITLFEAIEFSYTSTVKAYVYRVYSNLNTQTINLVGSRSDRYLKLSRLYGDVGSRYWAGAASDSNYPQVWYSSPPTNVDVTDSQGTRAVGSVTAPDPADLNDGDDLTVSDGTSTVQFHVDRSGGYVPLGGYDAFNVRLDISGSSTAADVATIIDAQISASALTITPTRTDALVELEALGFGSVYNQAITEELVLPTSTFSPVGMSGGTQTVYDDVNGRAASGQLVALPVNELANGNNFLLDDGVNPAVRYYFNRTGTYAPVGGWSTERVEIDVSTVSTDGEVAALMRSAIEGVAASGQVACPEPAELADGDRLVLSDGVNTASFWMDVSGSYVPGTGYDASNVRVDLSAASDPEHVAQQLREAVYGSAVTLETNDLLTDVVTFTNPSVGIVGNVAIEEHVAGGGSFSPQGMSGGNGTALLNLSVSGTGAYVLLENDTNGSVGNVPIQTIMSVGSLNEQGMSGGLDPWSSDPMNGYLQASMVVNPAAALGAYGRYSLVLGAPLASPAVGTRVLTWFDVEGWEADGSFMIGLNNGQVDPTLDGNDRFAAEFYREADDEVRVRLWFGGVSEQAYMPINADAMVGRQYLCELEVVGSGGDRATLRVFEAPNVDNPVLSVSVDKTAAVTYDRWSLTTLGSAVAAAGSQVDVNVWYVDVEVGTGTVVDATSGILVGDSKWRLFADRHWVVVSGTDGLKQMHGALADLVDQTVDETVSFLLNTVAPVVVLNDISFESGVEEAGYPKVSTHDSYDQLSVAFTSDKSGTYYVKLDSTAFTNGLLITSGSCVAGVGKVVPMFTQDLIGAGARDGLHEFTVYVEDASGNIGSAS